MITCDERVLAIIIECDSARVTPTRVVDELLLPPTCKP